MILLFEDILELQRHNKRILIGLAEV